MNIAAFSGYLTVSFALIFVIEGLLYALFPDVMKRVMSLALAMPEKDLRNIGFAMAAIGFIMIAVLKGFPGS